MGDETNDWKLPSQNVLEYKKHIQLQIKEDLNESFEHLQSHEKQLQALLIKLDAAKNQVQSSVDESHHNIEDSFTSLSELLNGLLNERKSELLQQLEKIEKESLVPLLDCEGILKNSLAHTQDLLKYGKSLSSDDEKEESFTVTKDKVSKFQRQAAANNCLPSVPDLHSVASVSVLLSPSTPSSLTHLIRGYGSITKFGPVQITSVEEKPGALLIFWDEISEEEEEEDSCVMKEFILECSCNGDPKEFKPVYRGPEMKYLMQNISTATSYWLRVTHVVQGETLMPWSIVKQCSTSVPHYCWHVTDEHWRLADKGRLVNKLTGSSSVVSSLLPQVTPGNTISIQVLEGCEGCSDEGVAISYFPPKTAQQITAPGSLFLSATGSVVVDGQKRLMRLPGIGRGSTVSFSVEQVSRLKLRVHIETQDKQVTYEWPVPPSSQDGPKLHFAACFSQPNWSLKVF